MKNDEFYIGYVKNIPKNLARFILFVVLSFFIISLGYAIINHIFRVPFHSGVASKQYITLEGVFAAKPYPMLLTYRLGRSVAKNDTQIKISRYYIVPPGKYGLNNIAKKLDGKYISVGGKVIYRDNQTMFVINKKSIKEIKKKKKLLKKILKVSSTQILGKFSLQGEIVDSKCYLGQMQPGAGKPHRACATLCIRGGLPPLFVTKLPELGFQSLYLILTSKIDEPVNQDVLNMVAEPIEITGEIIKKDNLYFFRSDPKKYKRLSIF